MSQLQVMVGHSRATRQIAREVSAASELDVTVLISGERGVGRRLIARTIHDRSLRHSGPFVWMNCACLPQSRLESELCGDSTAEVKDAAGGARGMLEAANGGTIVLHEIGQLSRRVQGRLLHFTETKQIQRVGSVQVTRSDARLMAITHRALADAVADHAFRDDLFYRMNVIHIRVPPLRERPEDVPALFRYFLCVQAARLGRPRVDLTHDALSCLADYAWPGNVRELKAMAERLALTCELESVGVDALPVNVVRRSSSRARSRHIFRMLSPLGEHARHVRDEHAVGG